MSQINEKSETKPATPQSLDARLCRCRLLALPVGVRALQDVFGTVHAPDLCTATGVEWNAAGKPLLPAGIERAPDKSCRCPPSNAAFSDAAVCPVHGNAATAAPESNSEFSRGVREGLERAAGLEKAARLLVGTYIRVTDPSWCGCCASHIGEGGGHRGDCEAASMLRALAAQEGREQPRDAAEDDHA